MVQRNIDVQVEEKHSGRGFGGIMTFSHKHSRCVRINIKLTSQMTAAIFGEDSSLSKRMTIKTSKNIFDLFLTIYIDLHGN